MSFNAEWTNADALAFRPYTAYASAPVTYSAATDPMSDLQRENAELRELVRGLYKAFMYSNCYRWCGFKEPCNHILDCKCQWYDCMCELGVEVG